MTMPIVAALLSVAGLAGVAVVAPVIIARRMLDGDAPDAIR